MGWSREWTRSRRSVSTPAPFLANSAIPPPRSTAWQPTRGLRLLPGLDTYGARQVAVHARDAFDLALGGEALVEALLPELARHFSPGGKALLPSGDAAGFRLGVLAREVGAHPHHCLDRHRLGDHVVFLAPHRVAEDGASRLEEVADDAVVAGHFLGAAAGQLDRPPASAHPAMQFVEQLGLQHPFVALAASAQAVDAVAQRAVALAVELLDQAGGELAVRRCERHVFVQINQMALVDARRGRVDDHEHLGRDVLAATD